MPPYASRCIEKRDTHDIAQRKKHREMYLCTSRWKTTKGRGALTIIDVMADEQDVRADYERKEEVESCAPW